VAGSRFNFLGKTGETAPASEMLADNNLSNNAAELSKYRFHARTMAKLLLCVNYSFELRDTNPHDVRVKIPPSLNQMNWDMPQLKFLSKNSVQIHELKMNVQIRFHSAIVY